MSPCETHRLYNKQFDGYRFENTGVFCPDCGVRVYQIPQYAKDVLVLKPGTLDDTSWLRPSYFVWMKSAQSWVPVPDGVKALERQT